MPEMKSAAATVLKQLLVRSRLDNRLKCPKINSVNHVTIVRNPSLFQLFIGERVGYLATDQTFSIGARSELIMAWELIVWQLLSVLSHR